MRLLSFDPMRSIGLPQVTSLKPESMFERRQDLLEADWVLFPRLWQVNALVYGLRRRIFPSISSYHLGEDKVEMTRAFQSVCPMNVPLTLIRPATESATEEALDTIGLPMVVKHPKEAEGRGVWKIGTARELRAHVAAHETLYAQELLPIDRDLRVVWVGDRVVGAYWRVAALGAFHNNVARGAAISFDDIPPAAVELVERVAFELGVDHAGFDVAMVDGHPYLMEFNTLFGTAGL
jgi:ribosomal protein S6--L-glutamate ligase